MDPILKDTIRIQIDTGDSIKKLFQSAFHQISEVMSQIRREYPSLNDSALNTEATHALDDLSSAIDALEYLCDGMKATFDVIPDDKTCG